MALESGTYVSDLNTANPVGTDPKSQGDDHLRLIKTILKATFPNATKAFRFPTSTAQKTSNYTAVASDDGVVLPVNGGVTVTLPTTGLFDGLTITVIKADHSSSAATISGNGNLVNGEASVTLYQRYQPAIVRWCSTIGAWIAQIDAAVPIGTLVGGFFTVAPAGYVLAAGSTIGKVGSVATLASVVTQGLYEVLWAACSNTVCPVSSGRGASAAADYAALKTLQLPDLRGYAPIGLDNLGGSAASRAAAWTSLGVVGGAATHTLVTGEIPAHNHAITDPGHTHTNVRMTQTGLSFTGPGGGTAYVPNSTEPTGTATTGITINNTGGDGAHNNMQPSYGVGYAIKL